MLWQISVLSRPDQPDVEARRIAADIETLHFGGVRATRSARGYLIEGSLGPADLERIGRELLSDPVTEEFQIGTTADRDSAPTVANVLLKPGVMDPAAQSVERAIHDLGLAVDRVRTFRRYWIAGAGDADTRARLAGRVLANDAIEQVVWGPLEIDHLGGGSPYAFQLVTVPMRGLTDPELERVSRDGQLSLSLAEMHTIQQHYRALGRDPTDAELETLAQTWSEHCSHKTLRGRIEYTELSERGEVLRRERFDNLLRETIFRATREIREAWGPERDWCVSVFEDNAGIVRFDDAFNICFKVETHNHPSAIEPYGGANTGVGGVIRDSMGTGLGAKPIANSDVFCFAPPDFPPDRLPPGVLHPQRVMKGVVAGVRDYGNRMGIPTVSGAIYFDQRYLGNPLVFCGNVGIIPSDRSHKEPKPGDLIVAIGGRTGRDGIHGATFSSVELTEQSERLSGGAVQIGNAITEKMVLDVLLAARDRRLYHAVTDCGAGGFSSAVGEMGETIGAEVWLDRVPLKYAGLSYTEIWISEAQERMVLAVPESSWGELQTLAESEGVEATVIGRFESTGRLLLKYQEHVVGDLSMAFLHGGRPPVVREAVYAERPRAGAAASAATRASDEADALPRTTHSPPLSVGDVLRRILSSWNVCSKEWVIRQYDHEVQGATVVKPLVGVAEDGPSDAAVLRPVAGSYRGVVIACGMNPWYGDLDPYWMAAAGIDEAVRNCVAVGADPARIAILDNFCWGNTDRPEQLGSLVRAALACRDIAVAYGTPFISGKDSLNNEFRATVDGGRPGAAAEEIRITIPPTLLISAIGQVDDVRRCVTMDLKAPGNVLYLIGETKHELGGSHYERVTGTMGGTVPRVNAPLARETFRRLHEAMRQGLVRSCHDLSEGGLAVALAEAAFAGGLGARVELHRANSRSGQRPAPADRASLDAERVRALFAESNSRFLVEVAADHAVRFARVMQRPSPDSAASLEVPFEPIGEVTVDPLLELVDAWGDESLVRESIADLREVWQRPLRW